MRVPFICTVAAIVCGIPLTAATLFMLQLRRQRSILSKTQVNGETPVAPEYLFPLGNLSEGE